MSLLNDMLRNLDTRSARPSGAGAVPLPPSVEEPRTRASSQSWLGLAIAVGAVAAALLLAEPWSTPSAPPQAPPALAQALVVTPAVPLPDVALAPIAPPPAARVTRLALAPLAGGTRLQIELSHATAHRLVRADGGREIEIALADTELGPALPELDLRRTPVNSFQAERADGELHIRLTTARPMRAHSVALEDGDSARVELELQAEPETRAAAVTRSAAAPVTEQVATARAVQLWREGVRLASQGELRAAESQLRESLELAPAQSGARAALAALLLRTGRSDDAEKEIASGRELEPNAAGFDTLAARVKLAHGDAAGALAELEHNPPGIARNSEYHALLAAVRERLGQHEAAAASYADLLAHDSRRADWWLGLGLALEGAGRGTEALAAYRSAAALPALPPDAARWLATRTSALAGGS
jgi:MSHA biogenesis protein MshN